MSLIASGILRTKKVKEKCILVFIHSTLGLYVLGENEGQTGYAESSA